MRSLIQASTIVLAVAGGGGFVAAQNAPGDAGMQEKLNLSQSKESQVTQGLSHEKSQSAAGYSGQVGSKPPGSLATKPMPDDVTAQVPETRDYLFIKLPDRILLIDPHSKTVAEIVGAPATTGSDVHPGASVSGPARSNSPSR